MACRLLIAQSSVNGNGATIMRDGAAPEFRILDVETSGDLTLNNLTISGGLLPDLWGNGIYIDHGRLALMHAVVSNSGAVGQAYGGGIGSCAGRVEIVDSTLIGNGATNGGAFYNNCGGTLTMTNTIVTANTANGGGLYNVRGVITLNNTALLTNTGFGGGGAIINYDHLQINNSILAVNHGGGIDNEGLLTVTASLFLNNTSGALYNGVQSPLFGQPGATLHGNCFLGNVPHLGDVVQNDAPAPIDAASNWWGFEDGPSNFGPGSGKSISAKVSFSPFLTAPPAGCPSSHTLPLVTEIVLVPMDSSVFVSHTVPSLLRCLARAQSAARSRGRSWAVGAFRPAVEPWSHSPRQPRRARRR